MYKYTQPLFCSLNLLFGGVLVAVYVVVSLRSLINMGRGLEEAGPSPRYYYGRVNNGLYADNSVNQHTGRDCPHIPAKALRE